VSHLPSDRDQGYAYNRRGSGHYRKFYGRLMKWAMSMDHALETLGFPAGATPSDSEVMKAQRQKLSEIGYRGLGGDADPKEATEINVAAEILRGRMKPDPGHSSPSPHTHYEPPAGYQPPPQKKKVEITFEEAKAKAGVPSGVEWLFVTGMQRSPRGYSSDEFSRSDKGWVAVGRTDQKFVFVGVEHSYYATHFVGGEAGHDMHKIYVDEYNTPSQLTPSWLYSNIVKSLKGMDFDVRFNSKVIDARGKTFDEKMPRAGGSEVSIKHMMVELGMVSDDDPSVSNRKHVVEMKMLTDHAFTGEERKPGYFPQPSTSSHMYWDGKYHGDYYKVSLVLNGKDYDLSETDWNTLCRLKMGGKKLIDAIFGERSYSGDKKNITRMPKAKAALVLNGLVEHFKDLPPAALAVLAKAADQVKGDKASL